MAKTNNDKFVDALLEEVIPQVEKEYHVSKDSSGRAVAGLSMGGGESLSAGLNHPDKFAWVGGFSSAVMLAGSDVSQAFPAVDAKINSQLRLLWIACGTDDQLIKPNRQFEDWLTSKGVRFTRIETSRRPYVDGVAEKFDRICSSAVSIPSEINDEVRRPNRVPGGADTAGRLRVPVQSSAESDADARANAILAKMSLEQKIDLLGGTDGFFIRAMPEFGVPALRMADGPIGVRNFGPGYRNGRRN